MFCNKCGAYVKDGNAFCTKCGSRIENAGFEEPQAYGGQPGAGRQTGYYDQPPYSAAQTGAGRQTGYYDQPPYPAAQHAAVRTVAKPAKKRKSKLPLVIGTIIGMIIVAGGVIFAMMHFDKPYEKTAEKFLKAWQTHDRSLLYEVTTSDLYDEWCDYFEAEEYEESYGAVYTYDYTINGSHKVEVNELSEMLNHYADINADTKNLYAVDVTLNISYTGPDGSISENESFQILVSKIDGKWKVVYLL